jgi:hypothetical protein
MGTGIPVLFAAAIRGPSQVTQTESWVLWEKFTNAKYLDILEKKQYLIILYEVVIIHNNWGKKLWSNNMQQVIKKSGNTHYPCHSHPTLK